MTGARTQLLDRLGKASAAIIVVGILASVAAGALTTKVVSENGRLTQNVAAERASRLLQTSIQLAEAKLQAVSGYFAVDRTVTPSEFDEFVDRLGTIPILKALQFVRIVPGSRLDRYVAEQRVFRPGFAVAERREDAGLTEVKSRDLHYVIEFISPMRGNEAALGLDAASNPISLKAYEEALSDARTGFTSSFNLVQNKGELALLIYTPVYTDADETRSVIGFASGVLSLNKVADEVKSERATLLGIRNVETGVDLMPVKPVPDGYVIQSNRISLPGDTSWEVDIASLTEGSPQAAGLLVFGLGALLTLLALAGLQQSRLQASNLRFGAQLDASENSLAAREAAYRGLFENASTANLEVDLQSGRIIRANEAVQDLTGLPMDDIVGQPTVELVDEEDQKMLSSALTSKLTSIEGLPGIELHLRRKEGDSIWVLASIGESSEAVSGEPSACIVMQDISARKKADEARDLLVRELAHRVRNTMQLIGSLADQTSRTSKDVPAFLDNFKGRLLALNSAQDALFDANWGSVRVDLLVPKILEPFEIDSARQAIRTDIENLTLLPQEAQTIALALHELANNASRHGALKTSSGSVDLVIKLDRASSKSSDRILHLSWIESGGEEKVLAPETTGFGSIMLDRLLARQHGGDSRFDWHPDGLRFEAKLPLANPENVDTDKKY